MPPVVTHLLHPSFPTSSSPSHPTPECRVSTYVVLALHCPLSLLSPNAIESFENLHPHPDILRHMCFNIALFPSGGDGGCIFRRLRSSGANYTKVNIHVHVHARAHIKHVHVHVHARAFAKLMLAKMKINNNIYYSIPSATIA